MGALELKAKVASALCPSETEPPSFSISLSLSSLFLFSLLALPTFLFHPSNCATFPLHSFFSLHCFRMARLEELFRQNPNLERLMRPDADELEGLLSCIQTLRSTRENDPEDYEVNFQLATALISHSRKSFVEEGVRIMESLVCQRWQANWSYVVGRQSSLPPSDAPGIARGVAVSRATAPPPSDDDEDSLVEVSEDSTDGASEAQRQSTSTDALNGHHRDAGASGVCTPSADDDKGPKDVDASKIRPGRIDDLALYHYYLTLGWIKLGEMEKATSCVKQMLMLAPGNKQGEALETYIEVAERQDTAVDAAKLAGISVFVAGAAVLAGALLRSRQNSS